MNRTLRNSLQNNILKANLFILNTFSDNFRREKRPRVSHYLGTVPFNLNESILHPLERGKQKLSNCSRTRAETPLPYFINI